MGGRESRSIVEFGDFQTPISLAIAAVRVLRGLGVAPRSILEPTCGKGSFLSAAAVAFPDFHRMIGIDINREHIESARSSLLAAGVDASRFALSHGDFFATDWPSVVSQDKGPWLILGNPPWVTNAGLGAIAGSNLPAKSNFQNRSGIDAITGKSNFDISEWMMLRYLEWLGDKQGVIAVLCKTAVARKILLHAWKHGHPIANGRIHAIDAPRQFGAAVDACFFVVETGKLGDSSCFVFDSLEATAPIAVLGFRDGRVIADVRTFDRHKGILGPDRSYVWRSGIKHDCAKVMELTPEPSGYVNGLGMAVDIEDNFLFPLLKSSDIGNGRGVHRAVMLVTQRRTGEDTLSIRAKAPKTWHYLEQHRELLDRRGSAIYRDKPPFSVFGVGDYSFSPLKVAISGLYKRLAFVKVASPKSGNPMVFDDTVNFLPCWSEAEADFLHALLTSSVATEFYNSLIHWDEKRPITIDVLKRLSIPALARELGRGDELRSFSRHEGAPLLASLTSIAA